MPQTLDHDATDGMSRKYIISNTELFCILVRYLLINAVKNALGGGPEPGITTQAPPFTPSAPHPVTTRPTSGGCQAIGSWHGNAAMDQWCVNNCKLGYCPADRCKCIWRPSLSRFLHQLVWKHIMNCSFSIDQLYELKRVLQENEFLAIAYLWCFLLVFLILRGNTFSLSKRMFRCKLWLKGVCKNPSRQMSAMSCWSGLSRSKRLSMVA